MSKNQKQQTRPEPPRRPSCQGCPANWDGHCHRRPPTVQLPYPHISVWPRVNPGDGCFDQPPAQ